MNFNMQDIYETMPERRSMVLERDIFIRWYTGDTSIYASSENIYASTLENIYVSTIENLYESREFHEKR